MGSHFCCVIRHSHRVSIADLPADLKCHETLKHIFWDVKIYEQVAHKWKQQQHSLCQLLREKWLLFSIFGAISVFRFKKQSWTNVTKSDIYALICSGDWLPWLESTHLCHQFSELFSVLFMRMNSYDPITALYYARGCITAENSNLMKELPRCPLTSVTIFNM